MVPDGRIPAGFLLPFLWLEIKNLKNDLKNLKTCLHVTKVFE
jgi:hypothetical protein